MRMTEAQIRRIIKEELLIVLEVQDVSVGKKSYLGLGTKSPNIATNPEVRTKPQSGNIASVPKRDFNVDPNSPVSSYENLIRNDPDFRNLFIQVSRTFPMGKNRIISYLRGLVKSDEGMDKMLNALTQQNIEDLVEYTQEFEVVRENKRIIKKQLSEAFQGTPSPAQIFTFILQKYQSYVPLFKEQPKNVESLKNSLKDLLQSPQNGVKSIIAIEPPIIQNGMIYGSFVEFIAVDGKRYKFNYAASISTLVDMQTHQIVYRN